jgi:hypothetical protein
LTAVKLTPQTGWDGLFRSLWPVAARAAALLALYLLSLAGGLAAYFKYCELTFQSVDSRLSGSAIIRKLFYKRSDLDHLTAVLGREGRGPGFPAVWDIDTATLLDSAIFIPTEMYGEPRYRRRPNIRIVDVVVWTGLSRINLSTVETPAVDQALERCRLLLRVSFETDAFGFKKTEFAAAGKEETVMFLGDSFTEGLHVRAQDTFVSLFGRALHQAGLAMLPVNAGVNGYGTLEEAWTAETYASAVNAKVLIENLYLNDVTADPKVVLADRVPRGAYRTMFSFLRRLKRFCTDHDLDLIVSVIPDKEQIRLRPRATTFQKRTKEWCTGSGVLFVDPLPFLRSVGGESNYFSWDAHLNEEGHRNYSAFLLGQTLPLLRARFGDHARFASQVGPSLAAGLPTPALGPP